MPQPAPHAPSTERCLAPTVADPGPGPPDLFGLVSLAAVVDALAAERIAVVKEMEKRHSDLLLHLESQLGSDTQLEEETQSPLQRQVSPCSGGSSDRMRHGSSQKPMKTPVRNTRRHEDGPDEPCMVPLQSIMSASAPKGDSSTDVLGFHGNEEGLADGACEDSTSVYHASVPRKGSRNTLRTKRNSMVEQLQSVRGCSYVLLRSRTIVLSDRTELFVALLIILNAVALSVQVQYNSFDTAYNLGWPGATKGSRDTWPGVQTSLHVAEYFFGIAFTLEVVFKIAASPRRFVKSVWSYFDTIIVASWLISLSEAGGFINPAVLRLARLMRLMRLLRLVRTVQMFDVLQILVGSLMAAMSVLGWSLVACLCVIGSTALGFNFMLEDYLQDASNPVAGRMEVFRCFGSFSRALVTVSEMTLANWANPLRLLQENVSEWYGPVILAYVVAVTFAMMQVIRAVFMQQTFKVAASDEDLMIMQRKQQVKRHVDDMQRFFDEANTSGEDRVSLDEFLQVCQDARVANWLAAIRFDTGTVDLKEVFELLCSEGEETLSADEVVKGIGKLKGPARSVDMLMLQHRLGGLELMSRRLSRRVERAMTLEKDD